MEVPTKFISRVAGFRYLLLALVFMAASTLLVSCTGGSGGGDKKTVLLPATITVEAKPTAVDISRPTTEITATVKDANGQLMQDIEVEFTIPDNQSDGDFAGFETAVDTTDADGVAEVTYTAGNFGGLVVVIDKITATAIENTAVWGSVDITVSPTPVGSLSISSGSSTLVADGTSITPIYARVFDTNNTPVSGVLVNFTASAGTLLALSDTTDRDGWAAVNFRSPANLGSATLRAMAQGYTSADLNITFIAGPPVSITGSASPGSLEANGSSSSQITVEVLDANNNPVNGETISFITDFGNLSSLNQPTNSNGQATVTYTSPSFVPAAGLANITAQTTGGLPATVQVALTGPKVSGITLNALPPSIPADGTSSTTIYATVTISGGGFAPDNTLVTFEIVTAVPGGTLAPLTASTTNGVAQVSLTSSITPGTTTVRASSSTSNNQIDVDFTPGSVTVLTVPNSLLGTGNEISTVTATLLNADGTPAPDGETVNFTLSDNSLGSLSSYSEVTAGGQGQVSVDFTGAQKGGTVIIFAEWVSRSISGQNDITVLTPPAFLTVPAGSPDPTSISVKGTGGVSTSRVTFEVRDLQNNLVGDGYKFSFELNGPDGGEQIQPISATTVNGQITTILRSGFKSGAVSISAIYANNATISTTISNITISSGPPVGEQFGMAAQYLNIAGYSFAGLRDEISIFIGDINGNPIPDNTAIAFKTYEMGGQILTGNVLSVDGEAQTTLVSTPLPTPKQGFTFVTAEAIGSRLTHVTSLAVTDHVGGNEAIYAGTNGGGVYKSIDSGASWKNVSRSSESAEYGQNIIDPYIKGSSAISIDSDDTDTVYVGTGYLGQGNIYLSRDGGANWNNNHAEEFNGVFSNNAAVLSVLADDSASDYVWAGTDGNGAVFSSDGRHFGWGGIVSTPAFFINSGEGIMTSPVAVYIGETWTVIYNGADWDVSGSVSGPQTATATTGALYSSDDQLVNFVIYEGVTPFADLDEFTFTVFSSGIASVPVADPGNTGVGALTGILVDPYRAEVWAAIYNGTNWDVEGSVSGLQAAQASDATPYSSDDNLVSFTITAAGNSFDTGDVFTFSVDSEGVATTPVLVTSTSETWQVTFLGGGLWDVYGTVTGSQANAITGTTYTDGNLNFDIADGGTAFAAGDYFSFSTDSSSNFTAVSFTSPTTSGADGTLTVNSVGSAAGGSMFAPATLPPSASPFLFPVPGLPTLSATSKTESWLAIYDGSVWNVSGTVSGAQFNNAFSNIPYSSDQGEVNFAIYEDPYYPFEDGDYFTFDVQESGLGLGKTINHIVKGAGNGNAACLYAASSNGIFKSVNGGLIWNPVTSFAGDNVTALRLHPTLPAVPDCTNDVLYAGTSDAGVWISTDSGTSWPAPDVTGLGAGVGATTPLPDSSNVGNGVFDSVDILEDAITESWLLTATSATTFSVEGTLSGVQSLATVDVLYTVTDVMTFTVNSGSIDFVAGDTYTFNTTRDPGLSIRDVWIDPFNDQLYAATYFDGAQEPHPVGNVYSHSIDGTTGNFTAADWIYANDGLPGFDPPDDTTFFPQYVFAANDPTSPTELYIGGAGINFYKALTGLGGGTPLWNPSKNGLTNLLMARMPILFSDDDVTLEVYEQSFSYTTVDGPEMDAYYKFYVEDLNGNPPITGSEITVDLCSPACKEVFRRDYADTYTHDGTFRDPSDPSTNWPYLLYLAGVLGDTVVFTFTPECLAVSPGCSGSQQTITYQY